MNSKYKTELCNNKQYLNTGKCSYGNKCQFAHGIQELKTRENLNYYKCHFVHNHQELKPIEIINYDINSINKNNINRLMNYIFN